MPGRLKLIRNKFTVEYQDRGIWIQWQPGKTANAAKPAQWIGHAHPRDEQVPENVLRALDYAQTHRMHAIGLTGAQGGKMPSPGRTVIRVPSDVTQFVQESHIMIGHILCDLVERSLTYHEHGVAGKASAEQR